MHRPSAPLLASLFLFACAPKGGTPTPGSPPPTPPPATTDPAPPGTGDAAAPCIKTGCSGIICADEELMSTCEYKPEYACYQDARCERQGDGACGWTETPELQACLADPPAE